MTTNSNATGEALIADVLRQMVRDVEAQVRDLRLDPMFGMTTLYAHKNDLPDAGLIASCRSNPMNYMGMQVIPSELVPNGFIIAMGQDDRIVVIYCRQKDSSGPETGKPT